MWANHLLHVPLVSFSFTTFFYSLLLHRCLTYVREAVQRASTKSQLQKSHLDTLLSERVRLEMRTGTAMCMNAIRNLSPPYILSAAVIKQT